MGADQAQDPGGDSEPGAAGTPWLLSRDGSGLTAQQQLDAHTASPQGTGSGAQHQGAREKQRLEGKHPYRLKEQKGHLNSLSQSLRGPRQRPRGRRRAPSARFSCCLELAPSTRFSRPLELAPSTRFSRLPGAPEGRSPPVPKAKLFKGTRRMFTSTACSLRQGPSFSSISNLCSTPRTGDV